MRPQEGQLQGPRAVPLSAMKRLVGAGRNLEGWMHGERAECNTPSWKIGEHSDWFLVVWMVQSIAR